MSEHIVNIAVPPAADPDRGGQSQATAPAFRETAIAALERSFDGPVPPALRAAAAMGRRLAEQRAALAEARFYERQAGDALRALCLRRRGLAGRGAPESDPELRRMAVALTRSRCLAVDRLTKVEIPQLK